MNKKFGKLPQGANSPEYAPDSLRITEHHRDEYDVYAEYDEEGRGIGEPIHEVNEWDSVRVILHPTADDYRAAGFGDIVDKAPDPVAGHHAVVFGWRDDTDSHSIVRVYDMVEDVPPVRHWTPLTLKRGAEANGWWDAFKAILNAANAYDDFLMCQYISEDDPMFAPIYAALCNQFGADAVEAYLNELPTED